MRGRTYTFVIEGGNNPDTPANYHPFYITDDPIGGFEYKNEDEREVRKYNMIKNPGIKLQLISPC